MPFIIPRLYSLLILSTSFLKLIAPQLRIALVTTKSSEQLNTVVLLDTFIFRT